MRGEEGRVRLRKAPTSCQLSVDSGMSEWGNPLAEMRVLSSEYIG